MQKKSLMISVLAMLIIAGLFVFTILFFTNPFAQGKSYSPTVDPKRENLSEVITVTDLQEIFTENKTSKPSSDEIIKFAKFYNNDKLIYWDEIKVAEDTITETEATLVTNKSTHYNGIAELFYTVNQVVDLESAFSGSEFNIGEITIGGDEDLTKEHIWTKFNSIAPGYDQTHLTMLNINESDNTVLLVGDGLKYTKQVLLKFSVQRTEVDIATKLIKTELGLFKTHWVYKPDANEIYDAIMAQKENKSVNINYIEIVTIEREHAVIKGIGYYSGTVNVTYSVDMRIAMTEHLTITNIGEIKISENDRDHNKFHDVILFNIIWKNYDVNPDIEAEALEILEKDLTMDTIQVTIVPKSDQANEKNYLGSVKVNFKLHLQTK